MATNKKRRKPLLLSHTRPTPVNKSTSLSSQATRSLIRKHHTLQKRLHTAFLNGDNSSAEQLREQLAASGGLQKYQEASIQSQSSERGGDSSKVLMEWINEAKLQDRSAQYQGLRMLEVGALKVDNACSRSGLFDMMRIDLHSQHPDIRSQDFMDLSVPRQETIEPNGFDIVSLSLVVNYIGDAVCRGEMLKRVSGFLRRISDTDEDEAKTLFPALFLVLPAPCVTNSRYLDEERLEAMMIALGYVKTRRKLGKKLVYYLWRYGGTTTGKVHEKVFKKQEVRSGCNRNNFTIILP
ncbi:MAG: hypothetical protein Q9166_001431 [cf. Caloplaca sp. 2 TL-2023]